MRARPMFWMNRVVDGIAATGEAVFPENDLGAPDWKSTELVARTLEYIDELPPPQRRLICALFLLVELAAILVVFGFRRFSRLPVERRTELIRGWRRSRFLPLRLIGDSLKAAVTMIYMSHPSVIAYIEEYRACGHPADRLNIAVRPGVLSP
jgi:hypothetical protein